jgi:hypothetical protein
MMQLVEECAGTGQLLNNEVLLCGVRYQLRRFQGMNENSGLPIPGLHRVEGFLQFDAGTNKREWIGIPLNLKLEDGRVLRINLADNDGRILSEGHGPSQCLCC